jgi:hypothetical protein
VSEDKTPAVRAYLESYPCQVCGEPSESIYAKAEPDDEVTDPQGRRFLRWKQAGFTAYCSKHSPKDEAR